MTFLRLWWRPPYRLCHGAYRSEMKVQAALQSIITFQVRYRTPFVWAGNRAGAEYVTYSSLGEVSAGN